MISDILSDACSNIRDYLNDESFDDCYSGSLREHIIILVAHMDSVRNLLDTPLERKPISS